MKQGENTTLINVTGTQKGFYSKPVLLEVGDLRGLTQAGSLGRSEGDGKSPVMMS